MILKKIVKSVAKTVLTDKMSIAVDIAGTLAMLAIEICIGMKTIDDLENEAK